MRKRNGFTMIEMLAVIAVIGILAAIAIPTVRSIVNKTRNQYYKTLEGNIQLSGIDYYGDHRSERPQQNLATAQVALQTLEEQNYLKEPVVDDKGNDTCSGFVRTLKQSEGEYEYTTCLVCSNYKSDAAYCDESYDPSANDNIYTLDAPDSVYSYYKKEIDVDKLEPAILMARGQEVGKVTALYESVSTVDTSVLGTRKDQVQYVYEINGKKLMATSDLIIYQNKAPNVTLTKCTTSSCSDRYTSHTWTNQDVKETVSVANYVHGEFDRIQIYNDETKIWETYCTNKSCSKTNKVNNNDVWTKSKTVRSIDKEGNVSAEANFQIKIDKIKPQCSLSITSGTKGNNNFYTSNVQVSMTTKDADSQVSQFGIWNSSSATYNGNSQYTITKDGSNHRIYGFVKDSAGNTNSCNIGPIKVDKTAPSCPSIKDSVDPKTWTNKTVELTITPTSDTKNWIWYTNDLKGGWTKWSTYGSVQKTVSLEAQGERQGRVVVTDDAGNSRTCDTGIYYIDKTAPSCPTFTAVDYRKGYPVNLKITPSSDTAKWDWYTDSSSGWAFWSSNTGVQTKELTAEGNRQGRVIVKDAAGNERECVSSKYNVNYCDSTKKEYGSWSSCKNGKQTRTVKTVANYNGKTCSSTTEEKSCTPPSPPSHTHVYEILGTTLHKSTHNQPLSCGTVHTQVYYGYCVICWNYGVKTRDTNARGNPVSYCPGQRLDGCKWDAPMYPNVVPD